MAKKRISMKRFCVGDSKSGRIYSSLSVTGTSKKSTLMVIWLTLQLVLSAVMTTLSTFHQALPDSCTANASDAYFNGTTTSCPSWEVSAVSLSFTILFLIVSIVDATVNMHHLVHEVLDKKTDESDNESDNEGDDEGDEDDEDKGKCKKFKQCIKKIPMDTIRIWYCWTIVNLIMILVAANTHESPWQSDSLKVLSNAGLLFFTWTTYAFLAVGIIAWYGNSKFNMEGKKCESCCCAWISIIYAGLITLHTAAIIAVQVVFFFSDYGSHIQLRIHLSIVCFVLNMIILAAGVGIAIILTKICCTCKNNQQ